MEEFWIRKYILYPKDGPISVFNCKTDELTELSLKQCLDRCVVFNEIDGTIKEAFKTQFPDVDTRENFMANYVDIFSKSYRLLLLENTETGEYESTYLVYLRSDGYEITPQLAELYGLTSYVFKL